MKRNIKIIAMTVMSVVMGFSALAESKTNSNGKVRIPKERVRAMMQRANMKLYGGKVRQAGSAKGCFAIVNAQSLVGNDVLAPAAAVLDKEIKVNVAIVSDSGITIANVVSRIAAHGGVNGVAIVSDDTLPGFLSAPEDGWCIVNVKKLAVDKPDADRLAARVRKEILRAFAFVNGGAYSAYGDTVMCNVKKPSDLDVLSERGYGAVLQNLFPISTKFYGLIPWHETTYRKACQEGWAPAPTNEYQQAIWDKVHSIPKNPMKIEFDQKKGR